MRALRVGIGLLSACLLGAQTTEWKAGAGAWSDAARWSGGSPTALLSASIGGTSTVTVPAGTWLAGDLRLGTNAGDRARVEVDGGQLVLFQDSLTVGEYSGGEAEFVLKRGAMHSFMDVFVGAASALAGRANKSTLRVQGGSFVGRTLTVGLGYGAQALVSIEGSTAAAVHVLDYVYIEGHAGGDATLGFTLDEHGVTPITIQSRRDGLRIRNDGKSHCRLRIGLSAAPPREDITLVAARVPVRGRFDDLAEGVEIDASFAGQSYRWKLTYLGGARGTDLVLKNITEDAADAPMTHARPMPEAPVPLWREHPLFALSAATGEPAFAGAEGFGAFTPGGRGGKVLYVDNLDDAGPGSLRAAVEATGARKVVFRVGGTIVLKSTLIVHNAFLTIDGQAAPGAGILLRGHGVEVRTHDIVLRYFRIRVGDEEARAATDLARYAAAGGEHALYFTDGSRDCIADHLSLSWSTDKILSVTKMSDRITIQWCILSEALNFAGHGYASLAGGGRVTWHHNLFAHNQSRNVRFQGPVNADFRNNVIYDWGDTAAYGEFDRVNYVGNYLKAGPSTTQRPRYFHNGEGVVAPGSLFAADNVMAGDAAINADNWKGMWHTFVEAGGEAAFAAPKVTMETAEAALAHVLESAGAVLPRRDAVDTRIAREVHDGGGHIVKWVDEAGGWPEFPGR